MKVISRIKTEKYEELVVEATWLFLFKFQTTYRRYTDEVANKRVIFKYLGNDTFSELGTFEYFTISDLFTVFFAEIDAVNLRKEKAVARF